MKTAFSQGIVTACDTEARKDDLFLLITIIQGHNIVYVNLGKTLLVGFLCTIRTPYKRSGYSSILEYLQRNVNV